MNIYIYIYAVGNKNIEDQKLKEKKRRVNLK